MLCFLIVNIKATTTATAAIAKTTTNRVMGTSSLGGGVVKRMSVGDSSGESDGVSVSVACSVGSAVPAVVAGEAVGFCVGVCAGLSDGVGDM